jgi:hypothetical protein
VERPRGARAGAAPARRHRPRQGPPLAPPGQGNGP